MPRRHGGQRPVGGAAPSPVIRRRALASPLTGPRLAWQVDLLARQIEALQVTQAHLRKQLEEAYADADRTKIELADPDPGDRGKRGRRDDGDDGHSNNLAYRCLVEDSSSSFTMDEASLDAFQGPNYRDGIGEFGSDDDDDKPCYRGVPILSSSGGPADEFDDYLDEGNVTYRGSVPAEERRARPQVQRQALRELNTALAALVAQGTAADENQVLEQLQKVKEVLGRGAARVEL